MAETFKFTTLHKGTFRIARDRGMWKASCDQEDLGDYNTPHAALGSLVGGLSFWPASGNPSEAGLPDDLVGWTRSVT